MEIRIYFVHQDGIRYTSETFPAWASDAVWSGASATDELLQNEGFGGYGWNVNLFSIPRTAASQREGWAAVSKEVGTLPVLVFQQASSGLVVGILETINTTTVRDTIAAIVSIQLVISGDQVNTDGENTLQEPLPYPDSFLPIGLYQGRGWEGFQLPGWAWLAIAGISGAKAVNSDGVIGTLLWGGGSAYAVNRYVKSWKL